MANMSLTKVPMPEQDEVLRRDNFDEVALGYTEEMAIEEAKRCLNCKNMPCRGGCPVNVRIPEFIAKVAAGDFYAAGVMYGLMHDCTIHQCAQLGSLLSGYVIQVVGTKLSEAAWDEIKLNVARILGK